MWHRIGKNGGKYWGKQGAGIMFTNGDSVLLLRRNGKGDHEGTWAVPGGKSEEDETMLGTAQRETREEIGHLPKCTRITQIDSEDGRHHFRTYICGVNERFDCDLSDEHDDYGWFDIDDLKGLKLHPKLKGIMDHVVRAIEHHDRKSLKNEMSGFAEFISLSELAGATGVVTGTNPPRPPKHSDYNIAGAPGRTAVYPKEEPIKNWTKKKQKKK